MRESEAAAYLNLTARTLRNYRGKGLLAYREVGGKTRPQIEYDAAELDRLKADLEVKRVASIKPKETRPKTGKRVTLGLSPKDYAALSSEATRYGMGVNDYARKLVREGLESRFQAEAEELRGEMRRLSSDVQRMQHDLAGGFEVVLEYVGLDAASAKKWVTNNLR